MTTTVGITDIAYIIPKTRKTLDELARNKQIVSSEKQLAALGFSFARVAEKETPFDLAKGALKQLIPKKISPEQIDAIIYANALANSITVKPKADESTLEIFSYAVSKLQYDFGMVNALTLATAQQGCVATMNAIWMARNMLIAEKEMQHIICVGADVLPKESKREIIYNIISDASCAVLVEKPAKRNKILSYAQLSKGYYWNPMLRENELIASYFPTAKLTIEKALSKAQLRLSDIDWIIPHNVSMRSWEILLHILNFPISKFFGENIERKGHSIAADTFINLRDAAEKGILKRGQRLLLFTFGFGANWSCLILEH